MAWSDDDTDPFRSFHTDPFSPYDTDSLFADFGGGSFPHDGGYNSDTPSLSRYSLPDVGSSPPLIETDLDGVPIAVDKTTSTSSSSSPLGTMDVIPAPSRSALFSSHVSDVNDASVGTSHSSRVPSGANAGANMTREMEDAAAFSFLTLDSDSDAQAMKGPSVFNFDVAYAKKDPQPENYNDSHIPNNITSIPVAHQMHTESSPSAPLSRSLPPFLETADFSKNLTTHSPFFNKHAAMPIARENTSMANSKTEVNDNGERFVELDFELPMSSSPTSPSSSSLSSDVSRASSAPSSSSATTPNSSPKPRRRPPQLTIDISSSDDDVPLISTVNPRSKSKWKSRGTKVAGAPRLPQSAPGKSLRKAKVARTPPKKTRPSDKRKRAPQSAPAKTISST